MSTVIIDPVIDRFLQDVRLTLQDDRPNHPKDNQEDDGIAGKSADWVFEILHRVILYLIGWLREPRFTL